MWKVIQHRYIRGSDQNDRPNVVWEGGRYKEARGQAKANLHSHLEMTVMSHEHFPEAALSIEMDSALNVFVAEWYDDEGLLYRIQYEVVEDV